MELSAVRYLHFLGIIVLASMLVVENVLLSKELPPRQRKALFIIDGLYGFGAVLTFIAGLFLWLYVGKPKEFYSFNTLFHVKLSIFFIIAAMSIIPTISLFKNRAHDKAIVITPSYIVVIKRIELILLMCLPLLATLIAQGIGL